MLLPPSTTSPVRRVEEGTGPAFLICSNPNSPEVADAFQWFRVGEPGTPISTQSRLTFPFPILRQIAGEYECRLNSILTGETASVISELIVECKYCFVVWLYAVCC